MLVGGFQPFTLTDFPGRSAAIVFTSGCNFRCPWCHNPGLIALSGSEDGEKRVLAHLAKRRGLLDGVVVTGGEPTIQKDLPDFIRRVKRLGFEVKLDTNGSRPGVVRDLLAGGLLDYVAMDVKAPAARYGALCASDVDLEAIRESIGIIASSGLPHEFRTTMVPGMLGAGDLRSILSMIPSGSPHRVQEYRTPPSVEAASGQDLGT